MGREKEMVDLSQLVEPEWSDSEEEESESDNEENEFESRISSLQDRTKKHELSMNAMKKDNYVLKAQVERCEEMFDVEKRRHKRLNEELHIMLSELS